MEPVTEDLAIKQHESPHSPAPTVAQEGPDGGETIAQEIDRLLLETRGQISDIAECLQVGNEDVNAMVQQGAAANVGAARNIVLNVKAIRDGELPSAPSNMRMALSAARSFRRQHHQNLTDAAAKHVDSVIARLEVATTDPLNVQREEEEFRATTEELLDLLDSKGGVYVFTYPHYMTHPTVEGTQRTLLKVGYSRVDAKARARLQVSGSWVPEDPWILKVYSKAGLDPKDLESAFHQLLKAADHTPLKARSRGKEWFETSIDFLDAIAKALDLEIADGDEY